MVFDLTRYSWGSFFKETNKITRLALPMLIAQIAQVGTGVVDTMMAGHYSTDDLAAVALGSSIFITFYVTLMGVLTALNPIFSHMYGAGKNKEIGEAGRQGLWMGLILGILGMCIMWAMIGPLKSYLELKEYVKDTAALYLIFVSLGLPAALIHRALHAYASSLNRPKPIMWVSVLGLLLNIPLNYIFIHGLFGMPALGGAGCGLATAIVFVFYAAALGFYIIKNKYFQPFGLTNQFSWPNWQACKQILSLGIPIGFSFFLEVSLFSFIALLIANLGEVFVASQQVVINISGVIYMVPQSLGAALSVCVGHAMGMNEKVRARYISGVGLVLGACMAILTCLLTFTFRHELLSLYTDNEEVFLIGGYLLIFNALFQVPDSIQTIASGALRGYKITKIPMLIHAIAFWGFGLFLGMLLAFYFNMGIYGFWISLIVSLSCAAIALVWYLHRSSLLALKGRKALV